MHLQVGSIFGLAWSMFLYLFALWVWKKSAEVGQENMSMLPHKDDPYKLRNYHFIVVVQGVALTFKTWNSLLSKCFFLAF